MLKQIMATALYPERELGKQFWQKVYASAQEKFGTTNIPVNTFNKVWIVPDKAQVYENAEMNTVFVVNSTLKVMLEQDYLAANKSKAVEQFGLTKLPQANELSAVSSSIIKQVVIPALEKEVNTGKNFAQLRQVYNSLILAKWYKTNLKNNVIAKAYVDRNKTAGIVGEDNELKEKIYQQYLKAFKKGVYNFIKEDTDPATGAMVPRKYFSGGIMGKVDYAMATKAEAATFQQTLNPDNLAMIAAGAETVGGPSLGFTTPVGSQKTQEQVLKDAKANIEGRKPGKAPNYGLIDSDTKEPIRGPEGRKILVVTDAQSPNAVTYFTHTTKKGQDLFVVVVTDRKNLKEKLSYVIRSYWYYQVLLESNSEENAQRMAKQRAFVDDILDANQGRKDVVLTKLQQAEIDRLLREPGSVADMQKAYQANLTDQLAETVRYMQRPGDNWRPQFELVLKVEILFREKLAEAIAMHGEKVPDIGVVLSGIDWNVVFPNKEAFLDPLATPQDVTDSLVPMIQDESKSKTQLQELERELETKLAEIGGFDAFVSEIAALEQQIDTLTRQADVLEQEIKRLKPAVEQFGAATPGIVASYQEKLDRLAQIRADIEEKQRVFNGMLATSQRLDNLINQIRDLRAQLPVAAAEISAAVEVAQVLDQEPAEGEATGQRALTRKDLLTPEQQADFKRFRSELRQARLMADKTKWIASQLGMELARYLSLDYFLSRSGSASVTLENDVFEARLEEAQNRSARDNQRYDALLKQFRRFLIALRDIVEARARNNDISILDQEVYDRARGEMQGLIDSTPAPAASVVEETALEVTPVPVVSRPALILPVLDPELTTEEEYYDPPPLTPAAIRENAAAKQKWTTSIYSALRHPLRYIRSNNRTTFEKTTILLSLAAFLGANVAGASHMNTPAPLPPASSSAQAPASTPALVSVAPLAPAPVQQAPAPVAATVPVSTVTVPVATTAPATHVVKKPVKPKSDRRVRLKSTKMKMESKDERRYTLLLPDSSNVNILDVLNELFSLRSPEKALRLFILSQGKITFLGENSEEMPIEGSTGAFKQFEKPTTVYVYLNQDDVDGLLKGAVPAAGSFAITEEVEQIVAEQRPAEEVSSQRPALMEAQPENAPIVAAKTHTVTATVPGTVGDYLKLMKLSAETTGMLAVVLDPKASKELLTGDITLLQYGDVQTQVEVGSQVKLVENDDGSVTISYKAASAVKGTKQGKGWVAKTVGKVGGGIGAAVKKTGGRLSAAVRKLGARLEAMGIKPGDGSVFDKKEEGIDEMLKRHYAEKDAQKKRQLEAQLKASAELDQPVPVTPESSIGPEKALLPATVPAEAVSGTGELTFEFDANGDTVNNALQLMRVGENNEKTVAGLYNEAPGKFKIELDGIVENTMTALRLWFRIAHYKATITDNQVLIQITTRQTALQTNLQKKFDNAKGEWIWQRLRGIGDMGYAHYLMHKDFRRIQSELGKFQKSWFGGRFEDDWPVIERMLIGQNQAITPGGIDLEKTDVQSKGTGVKTAFEDPAQLDAMMKAVGLKGVIFSVNPVTKPMLNLLLGFNASQSSPAAPAKTADQKPADDDTTASFPKAAWIMKEERESSVYV
ncbi:MAG: hypothetical protein HY591_06595 [Candidatus Omnitrophica bacterium]|nr:hypothetical protein [Candidatus Omnitrophota bacterium]